MTKVKSFAITFRPYGGVTDDHISTLETWCKKKSLYYAIVTEKLDSERHIHAAVILQQSMQLGNFGLTIQRLFPDLSEDERKVMRKGVKVMYNIDWMEKYMNKDDDTIEVSSRLPEEGPGYLDSYFPTPLESKKQTKATDAYYANLEKLYYEHVPRHLEISPPVCRNFLYDMMYNKRIIRVIRDDRSIMQISRHLCRYINKSTVCLQEVAPFDIDS